MTTPPLEGVCCPTKVTAVWSQPGHHVGRVEKIVAHAGQPQRRRIKLVIWVGQNQFVCPVKLAVRTQFHGRRQWIHCADRKRTRIGSNPPALFTITPAAAQAANPHTDVAVSSRGAAYRIASAPTRKQASSMSVSHNRARACHVGLPGKSATAAQAATTGRSRATQ